MRHRDILGNFAVIFDKEGMQGVAKRTPEQRRRAAQRGRQASPGTGKSKTISLPKLRFLEGAE